MRAAVFLDRDGTLNEEVGYLHEPQDVVLVPGAAQAVAMSDLDGGHAGLAADYLAFVMSDEGQQLAADEGFVPVV